MKTFKAMLFAVLFIIFSCDKEHPAEPSQAGASSGQTLPGTTPQIFARGIVPPGLHTLPYFTPDGKEGYWKKRSNDLITTIQVVDGCWTSPEETSFSASLDIAGDPSISPDGNNLYFASSGSPQSEIAFIYYSKCLFFIS